MPRRSGWRRGATKDGGDPRAPVAARHLTRSVRDSDMPAREGSNVSVVHRSPRGAQTVVSDPGVPDTASTGAPGARHDAVLGSHADRCRGQQPRERRGPAPQGSGQRPGQASARLHPRGCADRGGVERGHAVPCRGRTDVRRQASGVQPAVGHSGRDHDGRLRQSSGARRSERIERARSVLSGRRRGHGGRVEHLEGWPRRTADRVRAGQRSRPRADRGSGSRRLADLAFGPLREPGSRTAGDEPARQVPDR